MKNYYKILILITSFISLISFLSCSKTEESLQTQEKEINYLRVEGVECNDDTTYSIIQKVEIK